MAERYAESIGRTVKSRIDGLKVLAASPLIGDPAKLKQFYEYASGFRAGFGSEIVLADRNMQMLEAITQACASSTVSVTSADNGRSVTKQFTSKDGMVSTRITGKGPDLVVFNPNDPAALNPALAEAHAAGLASEGSFGRFRSTS